MPVRSAGNGGTRAAHRSRRLAAAALVVLAGCGTSHAATSGPTPPTVMVDGKPAGLQEMANAVVTLAQQVRGLQADIAADHAALAALAARSGCQHTGGSYVCPTPDRSGTVQVPPTITNG